MASAHSHARFLLFALPAALAITVLSTAAQNTSKADAEFLRRAYDTYQTQRQASPTQAVNWSYLGPTNVSGRSTDVAIADKNGVRSLYVGYATSGMWKSEDDGATWRAIFEHMPSTSIGDVAVAPS